MTGTWLHLENNLPAAAQLLRAGGLLIFPTETSYGLGCDATNTQAVTKIFDLKGRAPLVWPFPVIVADLADAQKYVEFSPRALELAVLHWPGALNMVLKAKSSDTGISSLCASADGYQSVRVSAHPVASELVRLLGRPIVATSANLSGQPALYDLSNLESAFGNKLNMIDGAIDVGELPVVPASTTIKVIAGDVSVLRQGSVVI